LTGGGNPQSPAPYDLDITPLANAVARLREGLDRHRQTPADDQLRDGLIQRFGFTYELCHRMLRRYPRLASPTPEEVDRMPFQSLIRAGNRQGLLPGDWAAWHRFREMRTRKSHAYHEETARQVAASIPEFLAEADHLLLALQARIA
jgi:nucleotidyltransferase substrate binding protein (TIGR01987 family)